MSWAQPRDPGWIREDCGKYIEETECVIPHRVNDAPEELKLNTQLSLLQLYETPADVSDDGGTGHLLLSFRKKDNFIILQFLWK